MRQFIQTIESVINNKSFEYQEDQTHIEGWLKNKKGNHFYVQNGNTEIANIRILNSNEIKISIPYRAHYLRKKYIGISNEYRSEDKNTRGEYQFKLNITSFSFNIEKLGVINIGEVDDPNHDSNVMTIRGLERRIIQDLKTSLDNYNPNDILDKIKNFYTELEKQYTLTNSHVVINASVVQIIENNNGTIIGTQKI